MSLTRGDRERAYEIAAGEGGAMDEGGTRVRNPALTYDVVET
jgi:hypothetical protein